MENKLYLFDNENKKGEGLFFKDYDYVIGVDEVGRGSIAGPVVAAAVVILGYFDLLNMVNDSKKLTQKQREKLYDILTTSDKIYYEIALKSNVEIDNSDILTCSLNCMKISSSNLISKYNIKNSITLVDGNVYIRDYDFPQKTVVKGDSKSLSIAAASIIAKVYRDRLMEEFHQKYPNYDFKNNKGYGTKKHCQSIDKYGLCDIHRKSFTKKILNYVL